MTSPTPPEPGEDCFPVRYCTDAPSESCSALVTGSPTSPNDARAIQVYIDTTGFVWVAVISYEWSASGPVPHWVWLFKSEFAVACADIKAADDEGYLVSGTFALVTDGRHKDSVICDETTVSVVDMTSASVNVRLFVRRGDCCVGIIADPCSIPPEGACDDVPSGETCDECTNCDEQTAPQAVLVEIDHNTTWLEFADGSFVLELGGGCGSGIGRQCSWFGCFPIDPGEFISGYGVTIRSITMTLTYASGTMQLDIEYHSTTDCGATSPTCVWTERITLSADSDCDTWFEFFNPPTTHSITACDIFQPFPPPYNTPNGIVRAI